jgi:hypothetical protein
MGNKKLIFIVLAIVIVIAIAAFLPPSGTRDPAPPQKPDPPTKSIVVHVTPVEGEPGAYVLEYDNGYVEVVHADGTREQLQPNQQFPEIKDHGVQSVRPNPHSSKRP